MSIYLREPIGRMETYITTLGTEYGVRVEQKLIDSSTNILFHAIYQVEANARQDLADQLSLRMELLREFSAFRSGPEAAELTLTGIAQHVDEYVIEREGAMSSGLAMSQSLFFPGTRSAQVWRVVVRAGSVWDEGPVLMEQIQPDRTSALLMVMWATEVMPELPLWESR